NLLSGPLDAILAGLSTEAAALVDSTCTISPATNYYFMVASTLLVAVVGTLVTGRVILPRFGAASGPREAPQPISLDERRGLRGVGLFTLAFVTLLLAALVPEQGMLRGQDPGGGTGCVLNSPFINDIVTQIAVYAAMTGWLFGR